MTAPGNPLSRRRFLTVGGIGAVLLGGGAWLALRGGGDAHYRGLCAGATPRVLSVKELGVLTAFCARAIQPSDPSQPPPHVVRVAQRIDKELTFHTKKMQSDVKAAIQLLEHGGWLHLAPTRFTRLPPSQQDAFLTRMLEQGTALERQVVSNLKLLSVFFYYVDERTWPGIHYEGPFAAKKAPPSDSRVDEVAHR